MAYVSVADAQGTPFTTGRNAHRAEHGAPLTAYSYAVTAYGAAMAGWNTTPMLLPHRAFTYAPAKIPRRVQSSSINESGLC